MFHNLVKTTLTIKNPEINEFQKSNILTISSHTVPREMSLK